MTDFVTSPLQWLLPCFDDDSLKSGREFFQITSIIDDRLKSIIETFHFTPYNVCDIYDIRCLSRPQCKSTCRYFLFSFALLIL